MHILFTYMHLHILFFGVAQMPRPGPTKPWKLSLVLPTMQGGLSRVELKGAGGGKFCDTAGAADKWDV